MRMTVKPIEIPEDPRNQVTSDKVFPPRKIKDKNGNYLFHPEGIFSERIFGKFGHCRCGKLRKPGFCEECDCRVLDKRKMPIFYIKFGFDLPNRKIDYDNYNAELLDNLIHYRGFMYEGRYIPFDLKTFNSTEVDKSKILFGKDAILSLGVSEEWYNNSVHRLISIPHTSFRKITFQNDEYWIGDLNNLYLDMISLSIKYDRLAENSKINILNELNIRYITCVDLEKLYQTSYEIMAKNKKKNVIDTELRGQPETGVIRAVLTNNFYLDEDVLVIGKYFIDTLYPVLSAKYSNGDGTYDIKGLNEELRREHYLVGLNRQPTIGQKSIMAMYPVFSEKDSEMFVIQANPIMYDGLAADVDGDNLNVYALYSKEACEEADKLRPSVNYLECSNSSIRNGMLKEFKYVEKVLGGE